MTESSRTSVFFDMYSMPSADKTPKNSAPTIGEKPKKYPMPIPPKEACVMPPLIKTMRRATMYVPMIPHETLASSAANTALRKNKRSNNSKNVSNVFFINK